MYLDTSIACSRQPRYYVLEHEGMLILVSRCPFLGQRTLVLCFCICHTLKWGQTIRFLSIEEFMELAEETCPKLCPLIFSNPGFYFFLVPALFFFPLHVPDIIALGTRFFQVPNLFILTTIFFPASPIPGQTGTAALWWTDATAGMVASFSNPAGIWIVAFLCQRSGNVPYHAGQVANAWHSCFHPYYSLGISVSGQTNQRSGLRTKWLRTWDYECESERWGAEECSSA